MLISTLLPDRAEPYRLLVVGAHPDDAEIGAGATIMRLVAEHPTCTVRWIIFTGDEGRGEEARRSAAALVPGDRLELSVLGFRDGYLPWQGAEVKSAFADVASSLAPDLVLTHRLEDAHQDHRLIAELSWQVVRGAVICEYEIPKWEGDLGSPNLFVHVTEELGRRKVAHLEEHFSSQRGRNWFGADTFWATLRLRGVESASPTGLAEAFTCRKLLV